MMRCTVVHLVTRFTLLLCVVGLLCNTVSATNYFYITPNGDYGTQGWARSSGNYNYLLVDDHDGGLNPGDYVYTPTAGTLYTDDYSPLTLLNQNNNAWPAGSQTTYNMAQFRARIWGTMTVENGHFSGTYYDWNNYCRIDVDTDEYVGWGGTNWGNIDGPIYEFQSGTNPSSWDLTQQSSITNDHLLIEANAGEEGTIKCDEVFVRVWNRDASWPATTEPTSGVKYIYPSADVPPNGQWIEWSCDGGSRYTYVDDHDDDEWFDEDGISTTGSSWVQETFEVTKDASSGNYNRMQLVVKLRTADPYGEESTRGDLIAQYVDANGHCFTDLVLTNVNTQGNSVIYRGPIVRRTGWDPSTDDDAISYITVLGRKTNAEPGKFWCEEIYIRFWNAS